MCGASKQDGANIAARKVDTSGSQSSLFPCTPGLLQDIAGRSLRYSP
jgi:hypothetical protein